MTSFRTLVGVVCGVLVLTLVPDPASAQRRDRTRVPVRPEPTPQPTAGPTPPPPPTATPDPRDGFRDRRSRLRPTPTPTDSPAPTPTPTASPDPVTPSRFRLHGSGWGPGVGMSQYGARGRADRGDSLADILAFYYPGTSVGTIADAGVLRTTLLRSGCGLTRTTIEGSAGTARLMQGSTQLATIAPGEVWELASPDTGSVTMAAARVTITRTSPSGPSFTAASDAMRVVYQDHGARIRAGAETLAGACPVMRTLDQGELRLQAGHGTVTGRVRLVLEFRSGGGRTAADRYTLGIAEMPASWHATALQAQAVTARTKGEYWHRHGSSACPGGCGALPGAQNYIGYAARDNRWTSAIDATSATVVLHDGATFDIFYSATNGGASERLQTWLTGTTSYMGYRAACDAPDPDAGNPFRSWTLDLTQAEAASLFGLSRVDRIDVAERTDGGAVTRLSATGADAQDQETQTTRGTSGRQIWATDASLRSRGLRSAKIWRIAGLDEGGREVVTSTGPEPPCPVP